MREPGIYGGVSDAEYHADDALSSTGVRKLTPPSVPALFAHWFASPETVTWSPVFDHGKAAHAVVLGVGAKPVKSPYPRWQSNEAKAWVETERLTGNVPLHPKDFDQVAAMAYKLAEHPFAGRLLDGSKGAAEQSFWWRDGLVGCRGRVDFLRDDDLVVEYKTTQRVDLASIGKTVADFGYGQQTNWYETGLFALTGRVHRTVHIFQMKTAPYLVSVVQFDQDIQRYSAMQNAAAVDVFRECSQSGEWPDYTPTPQRVTYPAWELKRLGDIFDA